jgi:hypothetical protein
MNTNRRDSYRFDPISNRVLRALFSQPKDPIEAGLLSRLNDYKTLAGGANSYGETFSIDTKIAAHTSPDAECQKGQDTFEIIINDGLVTQLDDVFVALANASSDANWFDVNHKFDEKELSHIPGFDARLASSYKARSPEVSRKPLSLAGERSALVAGFLAYLAARFVSDHEFFHAFNGHFGLLEKLGRSTWGEISWELSDQHLMDLRHALEIDADHSAFLQCILDLTTKRLPDNQIVETWTVAEQLAACALAPIIVLALWASEEEALDQQSSSTHPASVQRIHSLVNHGMAFVSAIPEIGLQHSLKARELLLSVLERVIGLHPIFEPISDALSRNFERCRLESSRLDMVLKLLLAPTLRKYAFQMERRFWLEKSE